MDHHFFLAPPFKLLLKLPDSYDVKITKICILWTLAELQAKMSKGCRFLLVWHHNYQVSLRLFICHFIFTSPLAINNDYFLQYSSKSLLSLYENLIFTLVCIRECQLDYNISKFITRRVQSSAYINQAPLWLINSESVTDP